MVTGENETCLMVNSGGNCTNIVHIENDLCKSEKRNTTRSGHGKQHSVGNCFNFYIVLHIRFSTVILVPV